MGHLEGKVAVVTGAGRGIGRGEALLLAAEGAAVVVNDLGTTLDGAGDETPVAQMVADEIVAAGGRAVANADDISTWSGAEALIDRAVSEYGDLNIVVNNAGVVRDRMSFNMDEADFDLVIKVHVKGHFAVSRFAGAYWRSRAKAEQPVYGRIINTTSEAGLWGTAGQANYAAAKGAIYSLTLTLAREYQRLGATVNAIAPRARTRMTESMGSPLGEADGDGFDDWHPDNVAPVVGWLASDAAHQVSGQVFVVTGGRVHLLEGFTDLSSLSRQSRWTVGELIERQDELFAGHRSKIPRFGIGF
ncbi:MAG TPA: SDR family oxidoreductase [Acidimicrobiales bacterium]|nr:SDR family oxidoreductase [Acidimicrobiales bacterium]